MEKTDNIISDSKYDYNLKIDFLKLLGKSWSLRLKDFLNSSTMTELLFMLNEIYKKDPLTYPDKKNLFKPFLLTPYNEVQVIIIDTEPVFTKKSNGLAFGNNDAIREGSFDPFLIDLFNTIEEKDYKGVMLHKDFTLENWAKQGVLLLNGGSIVSSRKYISKIKWYRFMNAVISNLSLDNNGLIFVIVGKSHQELFKKRINDFKHTILTYDNLSYSMLNDINSVLESINGKHCRIKW